MMAAALQMWREVGAIAEVAEALEGVGWAQFLAGDDDQACASFEESLRLQREAGDPHLVNRAKVALGQALVALGRVDEARVMAAEIIAFSQQHGNLRAEHSGWHYTADCALLEGNHAEALGLYRTSLMLARSDRRSDRDWLRGPGRGDVARRPRSARPGPAAGGRGGGGARAARHHHARPVLERAAAKYFGVAREARGPDGPRAPGPTGRASPFEAAWNRRSRWRRRPDRLLDARGVGLAKRV